MIEVTMLFKDDKQFKSFLDHNKIEEYVWKKGKITIDLTKDIDTAMKDVGSRVEQIEKTAPKPEPAPAPSTGDFF